MTVVEVVPLVAGAAPIVIGRGVVSAVVGVLRLLVESASLGVLDERLGVEVSRLLAVKSGAHLHKAISVRTESVNSEIHPNFTQTLHTYCSLGFHARMHNCSANSCASGTEAQLRRCGIMSMKSVVRVLRTIHHNRVTSPRSCGQN